jgi:hypothetical protein
VGPASVKRVGRPMGVTLPRSPSWRANRPSSSYPHLVTHKRKANQQPQGRASSQHSRELNAPYPLSTCLTSPRTSPQSHRVRRRCRTWRLLPMRYRPSRAHDPRRWSGVSHVGNNRPTRFRRSQRHLRRRRSMAIKRDPVGRGTRAALRRSDAAARLELEAKGGRLFCRARSSRTVALFCQFAASWDQADGIFRRVKGPPLLQAEGTTREGGVRSFSQPHGTSRFAGGRDQRPQPPRRVTNRATGK